jgi:Asp-tRNA(Asn)/Glu-tRNA(Gln) amidotransferase A subunit family amidase
MTLHRLSLQALLDGLRARKFTAEELTHALLARISALEPKVHAWAGLTPERAVAAARAAGPGVLSGIPIGIKDIMHVRGMLTGMGSPVFADAPPEEKSATVVRRLEAAGAFVLGKTVTAELAYFHPGATCNPWNPARTPGGSSMGSAAAVACGMVPAALGTQTNGSVVRPAAFCGCVGFKPSAGRIPRDGMLEFSATLDQVGVFARSVGDAALVASVLTDQPMPVEPLARPPRLAVVRTSVWHLAEAAQRARFARDIEALRRAGAEVEETEPGESFAPAHAMHRRIMYAEGARALGDLQARHRDKLSVALNRLIDEGREISDAEYREALIFRESLRRELERFLEPYDAIVTPPACGEAPATLESTGDPAFCTLWTLCGAPAIVLPSGFGPNRLPLGLQMVGRTLADAALLGVAQWCAVAIGFDIGFPDDST